MTRIAETFARCKAANRAAFIPFIMGGDPSLAACTTLLDAMPAAGADIIELGIPFSDPMADGPVIAEAGKRALEAGASLHGILEVAKAFRAKHATPLVLMGYLNPIYRYGVNMDSRLRGNDKENGYEQFATDAAASGVDGIIIVDLPPEEAAELEPILAKHHIALVRLIAPTSVPERLPILTQNASGYLYYVSITGITGAGSAAASDVKEKIAAIRSATNLPVCVGFGIKTRADVATMAPLADGVVVGSALVKSIHETHADAAKFSAYMRELADGCRR
ncbi:MAG: tryptophan synthase subunit alpha [Rickettsiales bacterium]|nr:tryptophan synthase subunit alpha [Rickettsiales bacterium]